MSEITIKITFDMGWSMFTDDTPHKAVEMFVNGNHEGVTWEIVETLDCADCAKFEYCKDAEFESKSTCNNFELL